MCVQNRVKNRRANRSSKTAGAGDSVVNRTVRKSFGTEVRKGIVVILGGEQLNSQTYLLRI